VPSSNRQRPISGLRIVRNDNADEASIFIYDEISVWGINAQEFVKELRALTHPTINVRINSPGGSVFDGVAIANALREHSSKVITHVDGLAASIASIIAIAGSEVRMSDNAFMMIHDPWTFTMGNAEQLRRDADVLEKIGGSLVKDYMKRTGQSQDQIESWMHDETWFDAQEAKDEGFIDVVTNEDEDVNDSFDITRYQFRHAPAALMTPSSRGKAPSIRDVERALREAGLSRNDARQVALGGYDALKPQRDAGADSAQQVQSGLEKLLVSISSSTVKRS
jgi:ATP-dependent Clp protease protease subunit